MLKYNFHETCNYYRNHDYNFMFYGTIRNITSTGPDRDPHTSPVPTPYSLLT